MMDVPAAVALRCAACGTDVAAGLLACPKCQQLVDAGALADLKREADAAAAAGDALKELAASPPVDFHAAVFGGSGEGGVDERPGAVRRFALGRVGHVVRRRFRAVDLRARYGHVAAMKYFGLEATAPMFIPGVGAFIRLQGRELKPFENARIGLAGPLRGLGGAVIALTVAAIGGGPMWAAIARVGAWINLSNLTPVWQLDGDRACIEHSQDPPGSPHVLISSRPAAPSS